MTMLFLLFFTYLIIRFPDGPEPKHRILVCFTMLLSLFAAIASDAILLIRLL